MMTKFRFDCQKKRNQLESRILKREFAVMQLFNNGAGHKIWPVNGYKVNKKANEIYFSCQVN